MLCGRAREGRAGLRGGAGCGASGALSENTTNTPAGSGRGMDGGFFPLGHRRFSHRRPEIYNNNIVAAAPGLISMTSSWNRTSGTSMLLRKPVAVAVVFGLAGCIS